MFRQGLQSALRGVEARFVAIPNRSMAVTGRHSKNVAGKKNKLDAARTKLYTRMGVKIMIAAKAGGTDPGSNVNLARALKEAHSVKLPKDNIERALRAASDASSQNMESGLYEVFGHGGVGLIVTTLTDNSNRAIKEVKSQARKSDVKMASSGSVLFQFVHKAMLTPQKEYSKDDVIEKAIDLNLEDVDFVPNFDDEETTLECIVTGADELGILQDLAHHLNIEGVTSLVYLPQERVKVSEEDREKNLQVIEDLEKLDDVDSIFHNMEL